MVGFIFPSSDIISESDACLVILVFDSSLGFIYSVLTLRLQNLLSIFPFEILKVSVCISLIVFFLFFLILPQRFLLLNRNFLSPVLPKRQLYITTDFKHYF